MLEYKESLQMKKVIVVAMALLASSAQATSGLDFGDLNYFLKSGQFNLTSDMAVVNSEVQDAASGSNFETNGYIFTNTLGFGIADNLNAFVGLDFAYKNETELPGRPDSHNNGLSNPYLGVNYRLINQTNAAVNVDFGAVARIKAMDSEVGSSGKDGNYNSGHNSLELNTRIGRKWNEANEWQVAAGLVYNMDGKYKDKGVFNQNVDTDARTDFFLRTSYQYRPVQEFMMNVFAQAMFVGEQTADTASNVKIKNDRYMDLNFGFTAKYLITETFIFKFNYRLNHLAEFDRTVGGTTSEQKNRFANSYGFGIDWLF